MKGKKREFVLKMAVFLALFYFLAAERPIQMELTVAGGKRVVREFYFWSWTPLKCGVVFPMLFLVNTVAVFILELVEWWQKETSSVGRWKKALGLLNVVWLILPRIFSMQCWNQKMTGIVGLWALYLIAQWILFKIPVGSNG